jgi:uncharacterized protein
MMIHMYLYCTRSTWWWYTCTCIVPNLHDDDTHVPVLYQIYMMMAIQEHVYHHHHVDLIPYRYMCTIIMYIWYNTGTCVPSSSCSSGTIKHMCIIIHDDGTYVPVLYQIYMMMIHMYLYCTRSTWWWYTCTCIVPDLHDDDSHASVLYQINMMMMVHMYMYCTRSTCM